MWQCQEKSNVELPPAYKGQFYSGESYVILFEFPQKNREGPGERLVYVMYFWLGRDGKLSEQGTSALLAIELDRQYGAPQVRVPQGSEPPDFVAIFGNRMIVRTGTRSTYDNDAVALFQLRGSRDNAVKAEQAPRATAATLNTGDSFVLCTPKKVYVWHGLGSFDYQEDAALDLANDLAHGREVKEVTEKDEPADFWAALGGKAEYCTSQDLRQTKRKEQETFRLRLYKMSFTGGSGNPTADEVEFFGQRDLSPEGVYIVDAFFELYVWIGRLATKNVKDIRLAIETAIDYNSFCEEYLGRLGKGRAWLIHEGHEPVLFKGVFTAWAPWDEMDYFRIGHEKEPPLKRGDLERPMKQINFEPVTVEDALQKYILAKHPASALKGGNELPFGVDPATLEDYVSDEDFAKMFGVARPEFLTQPKWKQTDMKRKSGLF
eukprot:Unigene7012_Nuclearia_a/m.21477 Unigene7012_Nuclearia_a/g.21477  ORF Unigene7012_Nuclearia_a/g.21477 Unigene7012_Nuclearia_a/m.21477 type:complete len:434 (+) Unigene7012_Nuclearia_a:433-1734(+)